MIARTVLHIEAGEDEHQLAQRLLPLEHRLLTRVVGLIAAGRLQWEAHGVLLDGACLHAPLQWDS